MFSRYSSEQVNSVPAGYLESAQAQANMYSNIGSTLASMVMKNKEWGLKEQEIAAERESTKEKARTNDLTGAKIDAGDKKLEFEAWKAEQDLGLRRDEQKFKTFTDADKILKDRLEGLKYDLEKATDQKTKDKITAEINGIAEQRGVISQGVSRYLKAGTFADTAPSAPPSVRTKRGALGAEYDKNPAKGVLLPREQYIRAGLAPQGNPNSAPSATSGAEGGQRSDDASSPSEADLQFPQTVTPEPEPPKVVDGRPATIVAGKPDTFIGHFGVEVKRSTALQNASGESIVGEFDYTPNTNRAIPGGIVSIKVNDTLTSPDNVQLPPEALVENQKTFRQMHVLKFILENGLDSNVMPTKAQALAANQKFNADKSPIVARIQNAYALLDNDQNGLNDESNLRFNEAFRKRFGMSVDKFMLDGTIPDANVGIRTASSLPKLVQQRNDILSKIAESTSSEMPSIYNQDPTTTDRENLLAEIKKDEAILQKINPDTQGETFAKLTKKISRAREFHDSLIKQSDAWRLSRENWVVTNKSGSEALRAKLTNINATIEGMQASEKYLSEAARNFGEASRTWIGARSGDSAILSGWLARNIVNFPRVSVPDSKGRTIFLNPGEYLDWVSSTKSYADFDEVNAQVRPPSQKDYDEALAANSEHQKLIKPLNDLIAEWQKTNSENLPDSVWKKFFDPERAAQENNVFAIMAAMRKPVTGGGNPSNFEQQMLLSGIPNPSDKFTFASFSIFRLRTTAILSMLSHARTMQNHGFVMSQEALNSYNAQYKNVLGRRITMAEFTKYQSFVNDRKGAYEGSAGALTPEDAKNMGVAGFNELNSLVERDFSKK